MVKRVCGQKQDVQFVGQYPHVISSNVDKHIVFCRIKLLSCELFKTLIIGNILKLLHSKVNLNNKLAVLISRV